MSRQTEYSGRTPPPAKEKSLVLRLTTNFFFRQLSVFIMMDFVIMILLSAGVLLWAESRCAHVGSLVQERGLPTHEAQVWMEAGNYAILTGDDADEVSGGAHIGFLGEEIDWFRSTSPGVRITDFQNYYAAEMFYGGETYAVVVHLQAITTGAFWGLTILAAIQIFSLFTNSLGNNRAIRKALRPLQELASTAKRLNSISHLSRREMDALADELDKISAMDLDSRIDLPATQKELRALAQAINALLDRVNKSYRAQMQFVSDASHELRTPIAVIQGYAALLDRWGKSDPEARQESIDAIRSEAKAMEQLVEQLLFLARGDNNSQPVKRERFDLSELAGEVLRDEILIHQDRAILPSWEGPIPVEGDQALLKQLMRILLDNSVKYSPPEGRIWLRLANRDGYIRVTVQDEGMGMPPEAVPHIFDRFYRTDNSRARQTGGTGLGLAIALWIVQRHGGWFEVVSREGLGTRMSFILPAAEGEKKHTA